LQQASGHAPSCRVCIYIGLRQEEKLISKAMLQEIIGVQDMNDASRTYKKNEYA
jgi:hypothetical protein